MTPSDRRGADSRAAIRAVAAFKSSGAMMWYLSKTLRVLWPEIVMATFSGVPSFTMFRMAVRRKSCRNIPGQPARLQAVFQARLKSRSRWPWSRPVRCGKT